MTTGLTISISEELVAELEAVAHTGKGAFMIECAEVHALLTERAELKRDAERYRWLRQSMWYVGPDNFFCGEGGEMNDYENHNYLATNLDAAIDAAMQSEAKP